MQTSVPIITFVGLSGTGKTTFLEKLIPELKARSIRLAVLKHDAHSFQMDKPGKDTWRFTQAGADVSAISNAQQFALVERTEGQLSLQALIARLPEVDLVLTEGYKKSQTKKIEIHRACLGQPLLSREEELLAVVTDETLAVSVPQIGLEDVAACADIILQYMAQSAATE